MLHSNDLLHFRNVSRDNEPLDSRLLSRRPRSGELQTFGRTLSGSGGLGPKWSPGAEPLIRSEGPQNLKTFHCVSSKFLHFPGDIVETQQLEHCNHWIYDAANAAIDLAKTSWG